ncbi:MAG: acyltransferase family protein, partial [Leptospiraceae bacterium]|nr:acyltransferase family protein [Leptospiraceae bacterium]
AEWNPEYAENSWRIIFDLLYVSNYFHGTIFHGWSLSLEEQFYLLFPVLLLLVFPRLGKKGRLGFLFVFTAIPLVFRAIYFFQAILPAASGAVALPPGATPVDLYNKGIYYPFHGHYDSIFIGIIFAYIYDNYRYLVDRLFSSKLLFYSVQTLAWLGIAAYSVFVFEFEPAVYSMVIRFPVFSTLWALVMLTSMKEGTFVNRMLSFKIYSPIAKLSYCAYLIHIAIMTPLFRKWFVDAQTKQYIPVEQWEVLPYSVAMGFIILFVAYFFHLVAERPFMILKEKYAGKQISFEKVKSASAG